MSILRFNGARSRPARHREPTVFGYPGQRVYVVPYRPRSHSGEFSGAPEREYGRLVTGKVSMRLWEGIGWENPNGVPTKEPHVLVRFEDGDTKSWEPTRTLHKEEG